MAKILTSAQMRGIEARAIADGRVTGFELMERAGKGVVEAILAEWPELCAGGASAAVLCGPGNNGGDGFVVARLLAEAGLGVVCYRWGALDRQGPDAAAMRAKWEATGGRTADLRAFDPVREPVDVTVDAVFGIGMARPLTVGAIGAEIVSHARRMVAVDVPTGLIADSGRVVEPAFRADLTVTFHAAKLGHYLGRGPEVCGKLVVADIGLSGDEGVALVGAPDRLRLGKAVGAHKFGHGAALVLAGGVGRGGAARLAARAALRVGAGLVTVGCPPAALIENAARLDTVMLRKVADGAALGEVLADARIGALCLGPGMGTGEREAGLLRAALGLPALGLTEAGDAGAGGAGAGGAGAVVQGARRVVLDADALTLLAKNAALMGGLHGGCVLTPHGGEFARLFPDLAERLAGFTDGGATFSKVDATRAAAERAGCVVLFKGADTVIADASGRCAVHSAAYGRAAPWLATAGSGDVLAGIITGLLARGFDAFDAACAAAWLHAEAAREFGPGLIAEDLPDMLPAVFRRMGV